jgi:glucoamylase
VHGSSFFTLINSHKALVQGALLAKQLNETCEPCGQASQILCFLQHNFWNSTGNYLIADINANQVNRSGINANPLLGSIAVFDQNATCNTSGGLFSVNKAPTNCYRFPTLQLEGFSHAQGLC